MDRIKAEDIDLKDLPEVRVEWVDSSGWNGWQPLDKVLKEAGEDTLECTTVGLLLDQDKDSIMVVQNVSYGTNQVHSPFKIPRSAITDYQEWPPQRRKT